MKTNCIASGLATLLLHCGLCQAVDRYVSLEGNHVPPFTNWVNAATNIQDAIDVSSAGEVIWVTNGVYATGGKVMAGNLTNRVAVDKALTLQSVSGPSVTAIEGQKDPSGQNGPGAVRCAWLTNGATLIGFTIKDGATRSDGDTYALQSGGGVWCASTNASVMNCIISHNSAQLYGGGVYSGKFQNCSIEDNFTSNGGGAAYSLLDNCNLTGNSAGTGGGAAYSRLNGCYLTRNSATLGGGIYESDATNCALVRNSASEGGGSRCGLSHTLSNCTITENWANGGIAGSSDRASLINCILWDNMTIFGPKNYFSDTIATISYCCTYPLPSGTGNISLDPQLLADGAHLAATSPCRGAGSSLYVTGMDIDGQSWTNPPSMGCDEWHPEPLIILQPKPKSATGTGQVRLFTAAAGVEPFYFYWFKDGSLLEDNVHYTNAHSAGITINGFRLNDAGNYQVVVSNSAGTVSSEIVLVSVHCVDASSNDPTSPHTNWATATTTIQEAIEVAALTDVVLVTNGIYATGGKVMAGNLTNRVAVDKAILVTSVNGPGVTVIQGQWDPATTNGPGAVGCAWLADGAGLSGFTLRDGATATNSIISGGGAWCSSTNAQLANCIITNCRASRFGGGVWKGTLNGCTLIGNSAMYGGGADNSFLFNCLITRNHATVDAGGAYRSGLYNCALTENSAGFSGGGTRDAWYLINCTVTRNSAGAWGGGI